MISPFRFVWRTVVVATALTLSTTSAAGAQSAKGVFLGIQYAGASVSVKEAVQDLEFGSGFGVHAGLGLSSRLALLANFDRSVLTGSNATDVSLTQYDALLRLNLIGAASPLKVFVTAGATARTANQGRDFDGIAPTGGGGAQLFITSALAVHGTALWTFGNLTRANQINGNRIGQQFASTGTRVQAGASLYLFGR
jgi:hypothetical protein